MKAKILVSVIFLCFLFIISTNLTSTEFPQKKDPKLWEKARKIHAEALVLDAHAHPVIGGNNPRIDLELGRKTGKSQVDFITMKEGGLDGLFLALPLVKEEDRDKPVKMILDSIEIIKNHVQKYPQLAEIVLTPAEIRKIHEAGKRAVLLSIEYPDRLGGRIEMVEEYYKRGIRSITITHDEIDRLENEGSIEGRLSDFGRDVIEEMNRVGMLIDITHASDKLQLGAIQASRAPVIASHSCMRALYDKPRNISDDMLKAMADKGGAVMVTFASGHLSKEYAEKAEKEGVSPPSVNIEVLIDHIDHAVKTIGADHVGLGSDFVGHVNPVGLETASGLPLITYHLLKRGYSKKDIKKILGGNLLKILERVEEISQK
jgi:membrane dipeptidase